MTNKIATIVLICLSVCSYFGIASASIGEVDQVAVVTKVIDGDTFVIDTGDTVRFADLNTPEIGQVGYQLAKDYVAGLVEGKTVYLDIDDKYTTDTSGNRLVALIYLSYNSTHYMNLNKALLDYNYATVWDHDNEFNPDEWSSFELKNVATLKPSPTIKEFPSTIFIIVFLITATLVGTIVIKRNHPPRM